MEHLTKNHFIENGYVSAERKQNSGFYDTHFHDFFELEYVLSGEGSYAVDGIDHPIQAGQLFFLTPFNFHRVDMQDTALYNVMFSGNGCNDPVLQSLVQQAPLCLSVPQQDRPFYEVLLQELCNGTRDRDYSLSLLNALLAKLERAQTTPSSPRAVSHIVQAETYIYTHFRSHLTLADVAQAVALSPGYLSRLFKAEKGVSFKTYLNRMRFEYAKRLLDHSDRTVMQICSDCGFSDYPNFIRRFKEYTGFYPLPYRQRHK